MWYEHLMEQTFSTNARDEHEALWHIIDVMIDRQARDVKNLYGDADDVYLAVEAFCDSNNIIKIPPLYASLFAAKTGFMSQAKFPLSIRDAWLKHFEEPIKPRDLSKNELVNKFVKFLNNDKEQYQRVLVEMETFKFPYFWSDDEEDVVYSYYQ